MIFFFKLNIKKLYIYIQISRLVKLKTISQIFFNCFFFYLFYFYHYDNNNNVYVVVLYKNMFGQLLLFFFTFLLVYLNISMKFLCVFIILLLIKIERKRLANISSGVIISLKIDVLVYQSSLEK